MASHPTQIGKYRIISVLGEGGMGTVYEAVQEQPTRRVALKVIRAGWVSPQLQLRFARESEALGRLQHPGIAQIYEAGTADGPGGPQSYFAMELIRGDSLTSYIEQLKPSLAQRVEVFARICDAVHYAHQQGVVHRDLKPSNILVDVAGHPKILDFGVALLTDGDVQATRATSVGEVVGTLQYMSPEQVNADAGGLDARTDVYSLGVMLYEVVSGKLPYDLGRKAIYEAVRAILVDEPVPLSSVNRRLAGDVEVIVAKALEKERARRYESASQLAEDLRRYLHDEPIVARRASAVYQLRKFARRNRALVTGLTVAAVVLMLGTGVSAWQAVRATAAERLAEARRSEAVAAVALAESRRALADSALGVADIARGDAEREEAAARASAARANEEAAKAQAINAFLQEMLASSDPANARGGELSVRELLDQASARVDDAPLRTQPEVRAAVATTIGRTYFALGLYDQAAPRFDSAYAIRRRLASSNPASLAESADQIGKLAQARGEYPLAEERLREALTLMRRTLRPDDDHITSTMQALGDNRYTQGDFPDAERWYREALRLTRQRHGGTGIEVAARLGSLGSFLSYTGRAPEALPLHTEAVAILRAAYGTTHPVVIGALISLADAQFYRPDYAGAEQTLREALPVARTLFDADHPQLANILGRLGSALVNQRRLEEAEAPTREALEMRVRVLGANHPDVQLSRTELARLLQAREKYPEADSLYQQALTSRRAVLGNTSPAVASTLTDLGLLALRREDWSAAESSFRAAIPIWSGAGIRDQELYAEASMGWALLKQERYREADSVLTTVLAGRRALFGDQHWSVGDTYEKMAAGALWRGRAAEAESLSVLGLEISRNVYGPRSANVGIQLINVATAVEERGDTTRAIPLLEQSLDILSTRPATDPFVVGAHRMLAIDRCATGAVTRGDSLIRATVARVPLDPSGRRAMPYQVRAAQGYCLIRAERYAQAEAVLLEAEAGLQRLRPLTVKSWQVTVGWLVELYQRWGQPEQTSRWRERLAGEQ